MRAVISIKEKHCPCMMSSVITEQLVGVNHLLITVFLMKYAVIICYKSVALIMIFSHVSPGEDTY
jgi:hypothetical protein